MVLRGGCDGGELKLPLLDVLWGGCLTLLGRVGSCFDGTGTGSQGRPATLSSVSLRFHSYMIVSIRSTLCLAHARHHQRFARSG